MKDFLGQEIAVDDYVSGLLSGNSTPQLYQVWGFTPKKVRLEPIENREGAALKFPYDLIKVDTAAVLETVELPPKDMLGQDLEVGDCVYISGGEYVDPFICEITSFVPRHAKLKKVLGETHFWPKTGLLTDLIKVDAKTITMLCLTKRN